MRSKIILFLTCLIATALTACATGQNDVNTEPVDIKTSALPVSSYSPGPSPPDDESGGVVVLPESSGSDVFGNRLNNNNIAYSVADGCYYLSLPYYTDDWEGSSDSILAYKNRLGEDLETLENLSYDSFERLQSANGKVYYISGGKLFSKEGDTESVILEAEISDYCIDGDFVYYKNVMNPEVWRKEIGSDTPPIKMPIENILGFQASGGYFFYHDGESVYMLDNGVSKVLFSVTDNDNDKIRNFLVDGVLLYTIRSGELYTADGVRISDRVNRFTVFNGLVYYATGEGVFIFDPIQKNAKQIIETPDREDRIFNLQIGSMSIQNNKIIYGVSNGCFGSAYCIFTSNPDGSDFRPLFNTEILMFQTFTYPEQGFSIDHPLGYTVHFDPGSFYSGHLIMVDIIHDFFVDAFNIRILYDGNEELMAMFMYEVTSENSLCITTEQGYLGYYKTDISEGRFEFSFSLEEFYLGMSGPEEYINIAERIFLEIVKSFTILAPHPASN